ncbi:MAG: hypothetical protein ACI8T1_003712 [Verrucomicrobiales bacterium]|jgi:hypothetical protein
MNAFSFTSLLLLVVSTSIIHAETPTFRNDILPIFSKANCNSGGCHGSLAGKGGFRLSLFGYDPESDYHTITRESRGRRIEFADPGRSLLLTKPTTAVAHKGGKRLETNGADYQAIAQWIAAGAPGPQPDDATLAELTVSPKESIASPGDTRQLQVQATYSDGKTRDVTPWAKFTSTDETVALVDNQGMVNLIGHGEGAITAWFSSQVIIAKISSPFPHTLDDRIFDEAPRRNFIDTLVLEKLKRLRLPPSPSADDATLIRRTYIDTIGKLPTPDQVRAYISDTSANKHQDLIDQLLNRSEFVDYWTYKWSDVFLVSGGKLRPAAVEAYYEWLYERVAENTPWDEIATRLVTAKGSSTDQGATNFFAVHQDPESMAENVSQAFLSLSIGCAKCHNHPLEKWTNDQYYAFANLFSRVRAKGWGGDPRSGDGERTVYVAKRGDLIQPRTGKAQAPAPLDAPPISPEDPNDRRVVLAEWLTSPDNPYFTRAIANRVWANFMGIGLVESIDDLRATNPPSNEALLDALADYLVQNQYDLRRLMRVILESEAYRRSGEVLPENRGDTRYYARHYPRRLMAEVLQDAIGDVTDVRDSFEEILLNDGSTEKTEFYTEGTRALQLYDSAVKSYFLKTFGRNQRDIVCECERSNQPSLVQVLHLSNGSTLNDKIADKKSRVSRLLDNKVPLKSLINDAYFICISRPPTDVETEAFQKILTDLPTEEKRLAVEDLFWALLTSREFLFQH